MSKMGRGAFKKWALEHRERLVLRFQLEQAPGKELVELAEERGHEVQPKDNRITLVKAVMGDTYVELPQGYNRRKVCRVLGIPTEMKARSLGLQQKRMLTRVPSLS